MGGAGQPSLSCTVFLKDTPKTGSILGLACHFRDHFVLDYLVLRRGVPALLPELRFGPNLCEFVPNLGLDQPRVSVWGWGVDGTPRLGLG